MSTSTNNGNTVMWIVGGIVALVILKTLRDLFGDTEEEKQVLRLAQQFRDPSSNAELWSAQPLTDALDAGRVFPYQVADTATRAAQLGGAVAALMAAPGLVNDDEGMSIAAMSTPRTYADLLFLAQQFRSTTGQALAPFLNDYLGDVELAAIHQRTINLRKQ